MTLILDCETNSLDSPTVVHCVVTKNCETEETRYFDAGNFDDLQAHLDEEIIIGHNIISYDLPILDRLLGIVIPAENVLDTLVLSRIFNAGIDGGHGLEAWGKRLGLEKIYTEITDWSVRTQEIVERCIRDVHINYALWNLLKERLNIVI